MKHLHTITAEQDIFPEEIILFVKFWVWVYKDIFPLRYTKFDNKYQLYYLESTTPHSISTQSITNWNSDHAYLLRADHPFSAANINIQEVLLPLE